MQSNNNNYGAIVMRFVTDFLKNYVIFFFSVSFNEKGKTSAKYNFIPKEIE